MARLRILLVQPSLQPPGGGNAVAAWMLRALSGTHEVTVCSWSPVDLDAMNAYYGTTVHQDDATWLRLPSVLRLLEALPIPVVLLKASLLFRHAKRLVADYDVVVCGHNETDFGPRTLQYIHYPSHLRPRPSVDLRWYHGWPLALQAYYALCDRIAGFRADRVIEATTLANSTWIAERMRLCYGTAVQPRVVPPPVDLQPSPLDWEARALGFVCIGRIAPEKELERVIRILGRVRAEGLPVTLHIIGSRGPRRYVRRIEALARKAGEWVRLRFDAPRAEVVGLIHRNRYGIHGMREEHFGIAPAEALLGGCIVFVPDGGGQVDIVGEERQLRYESEDDAVEKIVTTLRSDAEQDRLRRYLGERRPRFTRERFEREIRELVEEVHAAC